VKEIKRILIYRIGNLGDIVCSMPAMVAIRRHFSDSSIVLLTNKETSGNPDPEEILKGCDFLDDIITYNAQRIHQPRYLWQVFRKLWSLQIDLLVYLSLSKGTHQRLIRDWFFFKLTGCQRLVGFKLPKPIKNHTDNGTTVPVYPQEVDRLMLLLAPLGIDPTIIDFRLPINERSTQAIDAIWEYYRLKDKNTIIAICPGAKFPVKRWSTDHFAEVISELQKQFDGKILLIGGPGEKASGDEIIKQARNLVINLIGKTTYMESAEILSRCNLLVSNDCGPVHLAAAVGTPVVGVYSSRDYFGAWHPWGNIHTVLRNDSVPCRFCFKTECEMKQCINGISVEQVVKACQRYL